MAGPLSGPGIGLVPPQNLYPSELFNAAYDFSNSRIALAPGDALPVPRGRFIVGTGMYCVLQYLDPYTNTWILSPGAAWTNGWYVVDSDGFNYRVANLLTCPVTAAIVTPGSGYVQATTTITPSAGNSTWLPIVGGQLSVVSVVNAGAGYGVAPLVFIPAPPPAANNANGVGGIPAAAYATISGGSVSAVTLVNPGAGYPSAPTAIILPNPTDPNINSGITQASVTFGVIGAGSLVGALCTNSGAALASPSTFSLTVAGAGTSASVTPNILQTITLASVTGAGTGYPVTSSVLLTSLGGAPAQGSFTNSPEFLRIAFRPRPAQIGLTTNAGGSITTQQGTIYDGGLFLSAPTSYIGQATTTPTISLTMGGLADIIVLQPFNG